MILTRFGLIAVVSMLVISKALALPRAAVFPCDVFSSAFNLAEPWEDNTKTFANGNIRIAHLNTIEPAEHAAHLLIIIAPQKMESSCYLLRRADDRGFAAIDFAKISAGYDPNKGVRLRVPALFHDRDRDRGELKTPTMDKIDVWINQATMKVTLDQKL